MRRKLMMRGSPGGVGLNSQEHVRSLNEGCALVAQQMSMVILVLGSRLESISSLLLSLLFFFFLFYFKNVPALIHIDGSHLKHI